MARLWILDEILRFIESSFPYWRWFDDFPRDETEKTTNESRPKYLKRFLSFNGRLPIQYLKPLQTELSCFVQVPFNLMNISVEY